MSQYFSAYRSSGSNIKVELDLSSYATKSDLKNISHVDVSSFALKTNLASLKTEVDKLDADKLKPVPNDLAKLTNAVENGLVKKSDYNKLVTNVDNIDTTNFVLKTKYEKDGSDLENKISDVDKKIPDVSGLVKKTDFNSKITEVEGKIPSITGLVTNSALTAVENKIPDVSSLVKKTDYDAKISEIENKFNDHNHDKYINTPEFNTLAAKVFNARLAQANLVIKIDFDAGLKKFSDRVTFEEDGTQNYLVFQPMYKYFKKLQVLVVVIIYIFGNLWVCLIEGLMLIQHLITVLLQN